MNISPSLALRLAPVDKTALVELAAHLQRSQTDTVRVLVREALAIIHEQDAAKTTGHDVQPAKKTMKPVNTPRARQRLENRKQDKGGG